MVISKHNIDLTEQEKKEIEALNALFFPENLKNRTYFFPKVDESEIRVLKMVDGHVASHALIHMRTVQLKHVCSVASVGEIMTSPDYQHRGFAKEILQEINKKIEAEHLSFGILFCEEKLCPFYKSSGWNVLENPQISIGPDNDHKRAIDGCAFVRWGPDVTEEDKVFLQRESVFLFEPT